MRTGELGFDLENRIAMIYDGGSTLLDCSLFRTVGKGVARLLLDRPLKNLVTNMFIFARSQRLRIPFTLRSRLARTRPWNVWTPRFWREEEG